MCEKRQIIKWLILAVLAGNLQEVVCSNPSRQQCPSAAKVVLGALTCGTFMCATSSYYAHTCDIYGACLLGACASGSFVYSFSHSLLLMHKKTMRERRTEFILNDIKQKRRDKRH